MTDKLKHNLTSFAYSHGIELITTSEADFFGGSVDSGEHIVCILNVENVPKYLDFASLNQLSLGVVPSDAKSRLCDWLRLPVDVDEAIALAFTVDHQPIEILRCNDEIALGMVTLGSNPFVDGRSKVYKNRDHSLLERWLFKWAVAWSSILSLFKIHAFPVTLKVGDAAPISTAITGMVAIENDVRGPAARLLGASLSLENGFINALFIAPKSIMDYLSFLKDGVLYKNRPLSKLSGAVSFLRCREICVEHKESLDYFIDGKRRSSKTIRMIVMSDALLINSLPLNQDATDYKELVKTDKLPKGEEQLKLIASALPLFTHAAEGDFKDLFVQLREVARPHSTFVTLMVLSAIVASLGLFLSSPAVIIGAMVLAPLMSPIISLAMGFLRRDRNLLVQSLETIGLGVFLALLTAAMVTLIFPVDRITSEIAGRMQPNLLDLGVAIASGIAGAYAYVREDVAKSVSGVAIAVALVPPLCVSGIGLGWMDWQVISGAMLLFLTNLIGISLAAALTFLVLGYSPLVRARKGLMFSIGLMFIIAIPLTFALKDMSHQWQLEKSLSSLEIEINTRTVKLANVNVLMQNDNTTIQADVLAESELSSAELKQLKLLLEKEAGQSLRLYLTPRIVL
ncbi:hypothetical protein R50072_24080 [Simiduia litorea]